MRDQFVALMGLRFALFRNTLGAGKALSLLVLVFVSAIVFIAAVAAGAGLYYVTAHMTPDAAGYILPSADACIGAFLLLWLFGLLTELQRSDVIDFRKMLYLPVSLKMVFVLNYAASLVTPAAILFLFPVLGACLGLSVSLGKHMLLGIPIAVVFYLAISSWTYYVRGLLAILLENKRRRRLVFAILPLFFVMIGQLPNVLTHTVLRRPEFNNLANSKEPSGSISPEQMEKILKEARNPDWANPLVLTNAVVPLGWFPYGLYALAQGRPVHAGVSFAGLALLTAAGLGAGFRSTWRHYTGTEQRPKQKAASQPAPATAGVAPPLTARSLPLLDDDTAAMATASFLNYIRLPNIYMLLIMPLFFGIVFIVLYTPRNMALAHTSRSFVPALATVWPFLNFGMIFFNVFGVDREGFRALILLPTERRKYFLGKNIALFPFVTGLGFAFVLLSAIFVRPGPAAILISTLQILQMYVGFCVVGNFLSMYFPYRIAWEGFRNRNNRSINFVGALVSLLLIIALMLPTILCLLIDAAASLLLGGNGIPIGVIASVGFLIATVIAYAASLNTAGRMLQAREPWILDKLVRDRE